MAKKYKSQSVKLNKSLTHARVRDLLNYNQKTGILTWRIRQGSRAPKGGVAGDLNDKGYWRVHVDGVRYLAHRLIWFWMTGRWPVPTADHKDLDKSNNRWRNIRLATIEQQMANQPLRRDNKVGTKCVFRDKRDGAWYVTVRKNKIAHCLGRFSNLEEAKKVATFHRKRLQGEFWRGK